MIGLTAGSAAAQTSLETPPVGTLAQVMRGIYFPNSNLIFDVQMRDPGQPREVGDDGTVSSTFSGIYTGWQVVENAALALAEGASLINKPGRLCENGRQVPMRRSASHRRFAARQNWLRVPSVTGYTLCGCSVSFFLYCSPGGVTGTGTSFRNGD